MEFFLASKRRSMRLFFALDNYLNHILIELTISSMKWKHNISTDDSIDKLIITNTDLFRFWFFEYGKIKQSANSGSKIITINEWSRSIKPWCLWLLTRPVPFNCSNQCEKYYVNVICTFEKPWNNLWIDSLNRNDRIKSIFCTIKKNP